MTLLTSPSNFTVSLSLSAHAQAETARKQHRQPAQAKQAYLNALAVYATHTYLDCMAFDSAIATNHNRMQQTLLNSAPLTVNGSDQLECRPVLPTETELFVPPEVQCDRLGYIAIRLSEDLKKATLLGFIESVNSDYTPLSQLQPIEQLTEKLAHLISRSKAAKTDSTQAKVADPTRLSNWLNNVVEAGWQTLDSLLESVSRQDQLALGFRSAPEVSDAPATQQTPSDIQSDNSVIQRCKQIQLEQNAENLDVILQVGFFQQSINEVEVWVQLRPIETQSLLPTSLQLRVLDQNDHDVMQAEARSTEAIQLKFVGTVGEQFSLKIDWQSTSFIESFVI
ncbi:MAG: DUF1822 family protein [Cyanobacteria bacterium J06650_10]